MIQLVSRTLSADTDQHLNRLQVKVDSEPIFHAKVGKAETLWNGKKKSKKGKIAFDEIVSTLKQMCVSVEICNYCEQNEANDIEHIYPKSLSRNWPSFGEITYWHVSNAILPTN